MAKRFDGGIQPLDFFEQQAQAKRISRLLYIPFVAAGLFTAMATSAILLSVIAHYFPGSGLRMTSGTWCFFTIVATLAILIASMVRMRDLESGDLDHIVSHIGAQSLSEINAGILTREQTQFRNVVAEMAIASGVPMPQLYVMDHEININALSMGKDLNNAAIIASHGAVRMLNRGEQQALVAHEFSHILHGDLFLNMRLMGVTYGLSAVTLAGLKLISAESLSASALGRILKPIFLLGIALTIIGSIGHGCASILKHFIVRQRKRLADAATLQFTRDNAGVVSLLKKIAASKRQSSLITHTAHVEHMLFSPGKRYVLLSGHRPIEARIRYFDAGYDPGDTEVAAEQEQLRDEMRYRRSGVLYDKREHKTLLTDAELAQRKARQTPVEALWFSPDTILAEIGTMRIEHLITASVLLKGLPETLKTKVYDPNWTSTIAILTLLSEDKIARVDEVSHIASILSPAIKQQLMAVIQSASFEVPERLSIVEVILGLIKKQSVVELEQTAAALTSLVDYQQRYTPFAYALTRAYQALIAPSEFARDERTPITEAGESVLALLAIVSAVGHSDLAAAQRAYEHGSQHLPAALLNAVDLPLSLSDSASRLVALNGELDAMAFEALDQHLSALRALDYPGKQQLSDALAHVIFADGRVTADEQKLFRIICFVLGIPVPLLQHYQLTEDNRVTPSTLRTYMGE